MRRRSSGFTFIEVLVVMAIIITLMSMVAVLVPYVQKIGRRTESMAHVRNLASLLSDRSLQGSWPAFDGKSFVLSLVADQVIDIRNPDNLETFFSPGDVWYTLEKTPKELYDDVTPQALRSGLDVHTLTSYAGCRNATREHLITPDRVRQNLPILCDDDDGPVHDPDGLVMGFTDGSSRFCEWNDLEMPEPEDMNDPQPFLGDAAADGRGWLKRLASW